MLAPDALVHDRYRVVRQIGQGGMGAVYEAIDQRLRSTVALKQMLLSGDQLSRQFEREAQLLANLRHAALPKVIDHFVMPEGQFLVMEFIPGDDLATLLAAQARPFPVAEVLRWGDVLLDALDYLHTRQPPVIHRDIKPQNLKLTPRGEIILLDFGLAKGSVALQTQATTSGSLLGYTPQYAPLEQIRGTGTEPRSDLYSLAATMYHLLTGITPTDALERAGAVLSSQADPLRPAHLVNPQVPEDIAQVLRQAMALDVTQRFLNAAAMRTALRASIPPELPVNLASTPPRPAATGPTLVPGGPTAATGPTIAAGTQPAPPDMVQVRPGTQPPAAQAPRVAAPPPSEPEQRGGARLPEDAGYLPGRRGGGPPSADAPRVRERRGGGPGPLIAGLVLLLILGGGGFFAFRWLTGGQGQASSPTSVPGGTSAQLRPTAGEQPEPTSASGQSAPQTVAVPADALPLVLSERIQGEIARGGQQLTYAFESAGNQQIFINVLKHDPGMSQIKIRLNDPQGDEVLNTCLGCGIPGVQTLRRPGVYQMIVGNDRDTSTGLFELLVTDVPPPLEASLEIGATIEDGQPVAGAGNIEASGAFEIFTFSAQPGQRIFVHLRASDDGMSQIKYRLVDANDTQIFETCFGCGIAGVQELRRGGDYRLIVGAERDPAVGTYQLRITDVPQAQTAALQIGAAMDGGIEVPGASDVYTFDAQAGQQFFFDIRTFDDGMSQIQYRLLDAGDNEVFNTCFGCGKAGVQTLRQGGTYRLVIGNQRDATVGAYQLRVTAVPQNEPAALTLDTPIVGQIGTPGEQVTYTFDATAGQELVFQLLGKDDGMTQIKWRLLDADNTEVFNTCLGCGQPGIQKLKRGGTYRLVFGADTDPAVGTYQFQVNRP